MAESIFSVRPKSTTIITAALETAGATIQSDMLDYVSTASGQTLAGFLYMLAIVGALFAYASGGNYRWGRYLLIGPVLFFFLTNVRTESDGTEWSFGKKEFSQEAVEKVLRGVDAPSNGGGSRVALVYNFWNIFMSEVVQELIKLLNLTDNGSEFTFIQKVERSMQEWNFSSIKDKELRTLIKITLSAQCKTYFHHLRNMHANGALESTKQSSAEIVAEMKNKKVMFTQVEGSGYLVDGDLQDWLKEHNLLGQKLSCQELWEKLLPIVKEDVENTQNKILSRSAAPEQDMDEMRQIYYDHVPVYVERYSGAGSVSDISADAAKIYALDRVVARSLYLEIWGTNKFIQGFTMPDQGDNFQMGDEAFLPGQNSSFNESVSGAIQQFNVTDKYAQRGEFVNAALSLPYYQGVGLLILSAAYPFFAMMVVMPGRALGFFTWLGLWAWLKLWDLGFAVVMLIDNMLYMMFPQGPLITPKDSENAGLAWAKLLEVDPNYSMAVYYNLIAACLFAVPLVTGVFVKGGGGELINLMNQSWSSYAMRMGGASASYARSWQAQGYMADLQKKIQAKQQSALKDWEMDNADQLAEFQRLTRQQAMLRLPGGDQFSSSVNQITGAIFQSNIDALDANIKAQKAAVEAKVLLDMDMTHGQYAANRAIATRYYSHDLVTNRKAYYEAQTNVARAKDFYNITSVASAAIEGPVGFIAKLAAGGKGK